MDGIVKPEEVDTKPLRRMILTSRPSSLITSTSSSSPRSSLVVAVEDMEMG